MLTKQGRCFRVYCPGWCEAIVQHIRVDIDFIRPRERLRLLIKRTWWYTLEADMTQISNVTIQDFSHSLNYTSKQASCQEADEEVVVFVGGVNVEVAF